MIGEVGNFGEGAAAAIIANVYDLDSENSANSSNSESFFPEFSKSVRSNDAVGYFCSSKWEGVLLQRLLQTHWQFIVNSYQSNAKTNPTGQIFTGTKKSEKDIDTE